MQYHSRGLRRRRNTDKWEARLTHKDPATGELITTYCTVEAKTRKQAERALGDLIVDLELKGGAVATNITVREWMDRFLDYKEKSGTIEPSTVRGYRGDAKQLCRYIGEVELRELTIDDVNKMMSDMTADGYAPKTVSRPFRLLKQALNHAKANDLIRKNPCDFCKPPKRVKTPINALSRADRSRMLELARAAQPERLAVAIELALTTGMRRGEICALRWSDLGDDGSISVTHALGNGEGGFYEKEPKTADSRRTIPLTEHTYGMLSDMRTEAMGLLRRLGVRSADPYILGTLEADSRPYNPTLLGKEFTSFCKMNGFDCTFHDLRHTFATMMIGSGVDVRTVASYLGHASVSMTLNIYADVDPDAKRGAVAKIDEAFDDTASGFARDARARREAGAGAGFNLPAQAIPFTVDELEAMLAVAKRAQEAQ